jgi:Ca2+-binding EF-hand superfamily protein
MRRWLGYLPALFLSVYGKDTASKEADDDFIRFDIDRNGELDAWELTLEYDGYLTSKAKHEFFRDVDTNSNGLISFEEYRKFVFSR